jgi:hypothetical protein
LKASLKKQGLPMPLVCYRETCGHMYWPERMCNRRMVDQCSFRLLKPNREFDGSHPSNNQR